MVAFLGVIGAVVIWLIGQYSKRRKAAWQQAAQELGLQYTDGGMWKTNHIDGFIGKLSVVIDTFTRGSGKNSSTYTRFRVQGAAIPRNLTLKGEGLGTTFSKLFSGEDVEVDDQPFDRKVLLEGPEAQSVALMSHRARHLTQMLVEHGGRVSEGELYCETRGVSSDAHYMAQIARLLTALGEELGQDGTTILERLGKNATHDPHPGVRARNLSLLIGDHPKSPATQAAARSALEDSSAPVRLQAAIFLGRAGAASLDALVRGTELGTRGKVKALQALGARYPDAGAIRTLEAALGDPLLPVRAAAISELARRRHRELVPYLQTMDVPANDPSGLGLAVATAARQLGARELEPRIITLLTSADNAVKTAAAQALAACGTVAAVEHLHPHTEGFFTHGPLKKAAREAIATIQSRLQGAEGGRLSVFEAAEAGAVTLSDDAGSLSVAEEPEST